MVKIFGFRYCSTFVVIWQLMSNHGLIRLKNLSRHLQLSCVISYFFQLHLMLHANIWRFDVMDTVWKFLKTKQGLSFVSTWPFWMVSSEAVAVCLCIVSSFLFWFSHGCWTWATLFRNLHNGSETTVRSAAEIQNAHTSHTLSDVNHEIWHSPKKFMLRVCIDYFGFWISGF